MNSTIRGLHLLPKTLSLLTSDKEIETINFYDPDLQNNNAFSQRVRLYK